jgi:tetratricopeptide (TPR) repeat protein
MLFFNGAAIVFCIFSLTSCSLIDNDKACRDEMEQAARAQVKGDYVHANELIEEAVSRAQRARDPLLLPQTLVRAASLMGRLSEQTNAEDYLKRAIAAYDQLLQKKAADADVIAAERASALASLAERLKSQGRLSDASKVYADFFAKVPPTFNPQNKSRLSDEYCDVLRQLGHADQAERIEVAEGLTDPDLNQSNIFKSAFGSLQLGNIDEAATGFRLLQSVAQRSRQPEWQQVSMHWLAVCDLLKGDFKSAQDRANQSIKMANDFKSDRRRQIAQSLVLLSTDAMVQGKNSQAKQLEAQAIALDAKETVETFESLGTLFSQLKRYGNAEMMFTHALRLMDDYHADVRFKLMHQLGQAQFLQNKFAETTKTFTRTLPLAASDQDRSVIYHMLGASYSQDIDLDKAISYDQKSIALREKMKIMPDLMLHADMANVALCLMKQHHYKESEAQWKLALAEVVRGATYADRPVVQKVLADYRRQFAQTYAADQQYGEAARLYEQIVPYYAANPQGSDYRDVLKEYAGVLRKLHQNDKADALDRTRAALN